MARSHLFTITLLLASACAHGIKVDPAYDSGSTLQPNEGVLRGTYITPHLVSARFIDRFVNPDLKRVKLAFRGKKTGAEIRVETGTDGAFKFKAPEDEYDISRFESHSPASGPTILNFTVKRGETVDVGSLYSSCDPWNHNEASENQFRRMILEKNYRDFHLYGECLVFSAPNLKP